MNDQNLRQAYSAAVLALRDAGCGEISFGEDGLAQGIAKLQRERDRAIAELDRRKEDAETWCAVASEDAPIRDAVYDWARAVVRGTNPARELGWTVISQLVRTLSSVVKRERDRAIVDVEKLVGRLADEYRTIANNHDEFEYNRRTYLHRAEGIEILAREIKERV